MYVDSLQLENVKGFESLRFEFQRPNSSYAGWTVIVGGNSSGKSTILKAIALALAGPNVARQLINPAGWIHSKKDKATVRLKLEWEQNVDTFKEIGKTPSERFEIGLRWQSGGNNSQVDLKELEFRNRVGTRSQRANRGP